jgi:hypothetical protein
MVRFRSTPVGLLVLAALVGCSKSDPDPAPPPALKKEAAEPARGRVEGVCRTVWIPGKAPKDGEQLTSRPIAEVTVSLRAPKTGEVLYKGRPNKTGEFRIEAKPGNYLITITPEYLPKLVETEISQGGRRGDEVEVAPGKLLKVEILLRQASS